jgi:rhodanese-related sulfurtransferase
MGLLDLFGLGKKKMMIKELYDNGAIIVDVRSVGEFQMGHVEGSLNIPLDILEGKVDELKKKNKVLLLCCASGMRSGSAARFLKAQGIECMNAGTWSSLRNL